jgi:hypothetical protein
MRAAELRAFLLQQCSQGEDLYPDRGIEIAQFLGENIIEQNVPRHIASRL